MILDLNHFNLAFCLINAHTQHTSTQVYLSHVIHEDNDMPKVNNDNKLTACVMVRMTPEMKHELEEKVYYDRTSIAELLRDRIKRYISTPSKNQP